MTLKAMREKRACIVEQMSDLTEAVTNEERSFTDDESTTFNTLKKQVEAMDRTIAAAETVRAEQRRLEQPVGNAAGCSGAAARGADGLLAEERSFVDFIRGRMNGETRADTNMTKSDNGGAVIPTSVTNRIVEAMRNICPIFGMATPYNSKGTLVIPYEDDSSRVTAGYADEFKGIDATAQKLKSVTLTGFLLEAITKVSKSLLDNTDIELLNYVVRKVAEAMAVKLEQEYLIGTSGKISGIAGSLTNKITAANADKLTVDDLIELQDRVPDVYQREAVWIMHPETRTAIRKLKDGQGNLLLDRDATAKWGYSLFGKPVYVSDSMPKMAASAMAVYYGDMSGLASKITSGISIQVLNELFAPQHAIGVVAFAEVDAKIENAQKIAALVMGAGA